MPIATNQLVARQMSFGKNKGFDMKKKIGNRANSLSPEIAVSP
jgi:hypothetical protein